MSEGTKSEISSPTNAAIHRPISRLTPNLGDDERRRFCLAIQATAHRPPRSAANHNEAVEYGVRFDDGDKVMCRLTAPFSGRPPTLQHAGAQDLLGRGASSPAAKHFINPGPLQRFVRRRHGNGPI
jgi:hypothetical protein